MEPDRSYITHPGIDTLLKRLENMTREPSSLEKSTEPFYKILNIVPVSLEELAKQNKYSQN